MYEPCGSAGGESAPPAAAESRISRVVRDTARACVRGAQRWQGRARCSAHARTLREAEARGWLQRAPPAVRPGALPSGATDFHLASSGLAVLVFAAAVAAAVAVAVTAAAAHRSAAPAIGVVGFLLAVAARGAGSYPRACRLRDRVCDRVVAAAAGGAVSARSGAVLRVGVALQRLEEEAARALGLLRRAEMVARGFDAPAAPATSERNHQQY